MQQRVDEGKSNFKIDLSPPTNDVTEEREGGKRGNEEVREADTSKTTHGGVLNMEEDGVMKVVRKIDDRKVESLAESKVKFKKFSEASQA